MSRVCVRSFGLSIEGFGAGPRQDLQNPLGVRGTDLMEWFFATRAWRRMHGQEGGESGADDTLAGDALRALVAESAQVEVAQQMLTTAEQHG